jgi:hypothetical protein
MVLTLPPGSESSARSHMPQAREPGGLGGGPSSMVDGGLLREDQGGHTPQGLRGVRRGRSTEEAGEDVGNARRVDGGKGRGQGKFAHGDAHRAQDREMCADAKRTGECEQGRRRSDHRPAHHRRSSPDLALRRPEVGARCGKSARRVLSGGRPERAVPTGIPPRRKSCPDRCRAPEQASRRRSGQDLWRRRSTIPTPSFRSTISSLDDRLAEQAPRCRSGGVRRSGGRRGPRRRGPSGR